MASRALFFRVGLASAVGLASVGFGVGCSSGSSSKGGGDAGTPTGGGTAGTAGGMMHTVCTQIGQLDQTHAMQLTNCTASSTSAECEGLLAAKPGCESTFQAVYNCALMQPASSWTCDATGTHVSGCDTEIANVSTCATAATSTGSTGGTATTTATAGTTTGASTTGTTSGTTHPVCAQAAALDQMAAAAAGCSVDVTFQSDCETALGTFPCTSQFQALYDCYKAQPLSAWSCDPDTSYATLPAATCTTEHDALNTCAQ